MFKYLPMLIIFLFFAEPAPCQKSWVAKYGLKFESDSTFRHLIFNVSQSEAHGVLRDGSGGYIVTGSTRDDFTSDYAYGGNAFVMRIDSLSRPMWARTLSGSGNDYAITSAANENSFLAGYYITGYTTSNDGIFSGLNPSKSGAFLTYLDRLGNIRWTKVFATNCAKRPARLGFVDDGYQLSLIDSDILLVACDTIRLLTGAGSLVWKLPNPNRSGIFSGRRVTVVKNGNIFTAGDSITMVNRNGKVVWTRNVKADYILSYGPSNALARTGSDWIWLDTLGVIQPTKMRAQPQARAATNGSDVFEMYGGDEEAIRLSRQDSTGAIKWSKSFTGSDLYRNQVGNSIEPTNDDGCILAGWTNNWGADGAFFHRSLIGDSAIFVMKLDNAGELVMTSVDSKDVMIGTALQQNFPNPFSLRTIIPFTLERESKVKVVIIDNLGSVVRQIDMGLLDSGHHDFEFDRHEMLNGVYIICLHTDWGTYSRSMIVQEE